MIVVYPFYFGDIELALQNAFWMSELGGCKGHEILVVADQRCKDEVVKSIVVELHHAFDAVHFLPAFAEIDGWPQGANYFFRLATAKLQTKPNTPHFMWMEPDAIPLVPGWLDKIQDEFQKVALPLGKQFMGDRVQVEDIPLHMSGIGIYPNPIHAYAGEAYRAHDTAWDMAARDQIVPRAYFTKLIEHAWKHPTFKEQGELVTQIRKETVLFHSSKDGSLIDLLRERETVTRHAHNVKIVGSTPTPATNLTAVPVLAEPVADNQRSRCRETPAHGGEARESTDEKNVTTHCSNDSRGGSQNISGGSEKLQARSASGTKRALSSHPPEILSQEKGGESAGAATCDIFIRTYPADYPWLRYCLKSIRKFCFEFRKVWIVSPEDIPFDEPWKLEGTGTEIEWKVMNEESKDGYLAQQIHKLYADVITSYQADYILHVDSDNVFQKPCDPDFFLGIQDKKPIWYYTPYEHTKTPWQPIVEKFMGDKVENEFMRRFPIIVPRWLYAKLREFCHRKSGGYIISDYIKNQPYREFSEFNALGAYAWKFHHDKFHWINTLDIELPQPFVRQFWSYGGITDEVKAEIDKILGGGLDHAEMHGGVQPSEKRCLSLNTPPKPLFDLQANILALKQFAEQGANQRIRVMTNLAKNGLTPRWSHQNKKRKKKLKV